MPERLCQTWRHAEPRRRAQFPRTTGAAEFCGLGGGLAALREGKQNDGSSSASEKTALIRVRTGISYALAEATDEGHCGLPVEELVSLTEKLLEEPHRGSPETKRARRSAPLGSNRGHCFRLTTVRRKEVARLRTARHDHRLGKPTLAGSPGPDYRDIDLRSEPRHVSPTAERTSGALAAISLTSLLVIASANE